MHGYDPLSPRFRKVLHSLNGPAGENLKAKIMFGIEKSNLLHSRYHSTDQKECNQRLHYIMRDELMCPIVANAILKYLDILQFRSRMGMDERLAQALLSRNCTWLGGKDASICEKGVAEIKYEVLVKLIHICHLEQLESGRGEGNVSLPKR